MQQLTIEHKNTTEKKKNRREGKGRVLAISRQIYRLQNRTDTIFYVESESSDNNYYIVKFKPDGLESYCSCKDNSMRGLKCKHLFAIEFAIKWGTIKDIEGQPSLLALTTSINNELGQTNLQSCKLGHPNLSRDKLGQTNNNGITNKTIKPYLDDDYDF